MCSSKAHKFFPKCWTVPLSFVKEYFGCHRKKYKCLEVIVLNKTERPEHFELQSSMSACLQSSLQSFGIIRIKWAVSVVRHSLCRRPCRPTSVRIWPLGGHARPLTVVPHSLRASLQLLQPNLQLPLLPEQTALQLLRALILLLQLL